jgi:outer membrane protein
MRSRGAARQAALCASLTVLVLRGLGGSPAAAADPPLQPGAALTLRQAVRIALRYHPARLEAQSEAGAAAQRVGEAQAALLPQVFGGAQYLRGTDNGIGGTTYVGMPFFPRVPSNGEANSTETFDNYVMGASAYQYLFDFGRTRGFIDQRRAEADVEHARLQFVELDIIYQVTSSYAKLLAAQQKVKVFEKAVAERTEQLHAARVKAEAGLKPQIDIVTAQAEVERARLHLIDARNAAATAKVALDNAMGLGDRAPAYRLAEALTYGPIPGALGSYLQTAYKLRPDLRMLEDEARAAGAQIREFKSDYLPTVGATANYSSRGQGLPAANNFDAGLVITWPLFNGFLTTHEVTEAKLHEDAIRHSIEGIRQRIVLQVKSAFLDWQAALQRIHRAERTLDASRVELELAQKRYETGLGNIIELTDAQRRFTEDESGYVDALAAFNIAKALLQRNVGVGLPAA